MKILEHYKVAWIFRYDIHNSYLHFGKDPIPVRSYKGKFVFVKNRYKLAKGRGRSLLDDWRMVRKL